MIAAIAGAGGGATASAASGSGGTATVIVVGSSIPSLDPALDVNVGTDSTYMAAIYGGLFYQKPDGGIGYNLATSAAWSDNNKVLTIGIRQGVKFSDGTPLTAAAVAYNLQRDDKNNCVCFNFFADVASIKASGNTVTITTKVPDASLLENFLNNGPNWPASPTAIAKEPGSRFGLKPVGAGPFIVTSFSPNDQITLVRNQNYWEKGHPYLAGLHFITSPVDQSAYNALQAGTAQIVTDIATVPLIQQAKTSSTLAVLTAKSPVATDLELNAKAAPFNNIKAREAVAYAINPKVLLQAISPGFGVVVQDEEGPGGLGYEATVPGYRAYNPSKARSLVKQLGGLSMTIQGISSSSSELQLGALQSQLSAAGIKVKLQPEPLANEDNNFKSGNWQAEVGGAGGVNADDGPESFVSRFSSDGVFSCCTDSHLDALITQSQEISNPSKDAKIFRDIFAYITKQQYVVPLYSTPEPVLYSRQVQGLTVAPGNASILVALDWADISLKK